MDPKEKGMGNLPLIFHRFNIISTHFNHMLNRIKNAAIQLRVVFSSALDCRTLMESKGNAGVFVGLTWWKGGLNAWS